MTCMKQPFVTKDQLVGIAERYPTPFHLYDEASIRANARAVAEAFSWNPGFREYFAVKANPNPSLVRILAEYGCGCDCSSYTELMIARALTTLRFDSDDYDSALAQAQALIREQHADKVVLGLPRHMNGDIGVRGEISIAFKEKLESSGVEVVLWDERLTTVAANRILLQGDVSRKKR